MFIPSIDIDITKNGKNVGNIWVSDTSNETAEGKTATPIAVIKNGEGPTALLIGGIHGDEYVGQIALTKLIQSIQAQDIQGRLIIIPAANICHGVQGP